MDGLSKELQSVYNWCEHKVNIIEESLELIDDPVLKQMMITHQSAVYWAVQQYILDNFATRKVGDNNDN